MLVQFTIMIKAKLKCAVDGRTKFHHLLAAQIILARTRILCGRARFGGENGGSKATPLVRLGKHVVLN